MVRDIFWPVLAPSLLFGLGMGAIMPVLVLAALAAGASASLASLVVGGMGLAALVFTVPAGIVTDLLGDRRAMFVATGGAIVASLIAVVALAFPTRASLWLYALALLILAPVQNVWSLARQSTVAEKVAPRYVGQAMTLLGGTGRIGQLVGPMVSAGLLLIFPHWSVFVAMTAFALMAVGVLYSPKLGGGQVPQRGTSPEAESSTGAGAAEGVEATERDAESPAGPAPKLPPATIRSLDVRWGAFFLAGLPIAVISILRRSHPIIVPLAGRAVGIDDSGIALLMAMGAAVELLIMVPGGILKDVLGRAFSLVACLGIFGAGIAVLGLVVLTHSGQHSRTVLWVVVAMVVMALGNGLGAGINMTVGVDLSPAHGRARFLGVWTGFTNVGQLAGPTLVSVTVAVSVPLSTFALAVLAGVGGVWMIAFARIINLPGRRHRRAE